VVDYSHRLGNVSEESAEAELYFNPYKLRWFDMVIIVLFLFMPVFMPIIGLFLVVLFIWGLLWGFFAWGFVARWWTYARPFSGLTYRGRVNLIRNKKRGNTLIRIDSYVMENRPVDWKQNIGFTIKQARMGVVLIFTLLFVTVRSKWNEFLYSGEGTRMLESSNGADLFSGWTMFVVLFSPAITCALVPLFISRDSSIVAVVPGQRDFNPIGREIETRLGGLIGWGSLILVSATFGSMLLKALQTSSWDMIYEFILQMFVLLSTSCVMVLGAACGYRNKTHFNRVDEFNNLFIGVNDWDHDFQRFELPGGGSGVLVAPHELMPSLLTYTKKLLPKVKPRFHFEASSSAPAVNQGAPESTPPVAAQAPPPAPDFGQPIPPPD